MPIDARQLGYLIDRHGPALRLYARQWSEAPDDVVQEAFVKLARQGSLPDFPAAWLYRVVRNAAISDQRARLRRRNHEQRFAERSEPWFEPEPLGATDEARMAALALSALPIEQREIIVAHLWGELTFEQVGKLAGCSAATAYRRYAAGLAALRQRLEEPCPTQK